MSRTNVRPSYASGKAGEIIAQTFLEREGYLLIDVNVRFGKKAGVPGEIDIVAWEGPTLCFIEVKTRQQKGVAMAPAAAVTFVKQRQLTLLATRYASKYGILGDGETSMRFDVVAVVLASGNRDTPYPLQIDLIRGAFPAVEF